MKGLYKNKYRIATTRHPEWDYGTDAAYFITICTDHRIHYFGEIYNGIIQLSPIGEYAENFWYEIPLHFPFVKLGAFIVMPNHIHGIIIINKNNFKKIDHPHPHPQPVETQNFASLPPQPSSIPPSSIPPPSETPLPPSSIPPPSEKSPPSETPLPPPSETPSTNYPPTKNKFGPQSQNLASIIRGYKIGVTKSAKKINSNWKWQTRYHDSIIRNEASFKRITEYIINNPKNWGEDRFHPK